jgi:hypothetical protein
MDTEPNLQGGGISRVNQWNVIQEYLGNHKPQMHGL